MMLNQLFFRCHHSIHAFPVVDVAVVQGTDTVDVVEIAVAVVAVDVDVVVAVAGIDNFYYCYRCLYAVYYDVADAVGNCY